MEVLGSYHQCPIRDEAGNQLVYWIARYSGSCVYGTTAAFSWTFGIISLVAWLGAQLPQIVTNYQNGSVEGLSLGLVVNWFMGDFTNFVGCVLTHQMPFQTLLAFYYICVDLVLSGQYYYYTRPERERPHPHYHRHQHQHHHHHQHGHHQQDGQDQQNMTLLQNTLPQQQGQMLPSNQTEQHPQTSTRPVNVPGSIAHATNQAFLESDISNTPPSSFCKSQSVVSLRRLLTSSFVASFSKVRAAPIFDAPADLSSTTSPAKLLQTVTHTGLFASIALKAEVVGVIFAWTCTCCYLTSRIPQIYSNFRRKSTSGTSILLFLAALTGNTAYTLSILLSPSAQGPGGLQFLRNELPFLLGAAGTVIFDVTIFIQWLVYSGKSNDSLEKSGYKPLNTQTIDGVLVNGRDSSVQSLARDTKIQKAGLDDPKLTMLGPTSSRSSADSSSSQHGDHYNSESATTIHASEQTPLSSSPRPSSYNSLV